MPSPRPTRLLAALTAGTFLACNGGLDPASDPVPDPEPPELEAPTFARLTEPQLRASVVDLLGEDLPPYVLQKDTNPYLFATIGASTTTLSERGVDQLEVAADAVTTWVFDDPARREALVGCTPTAPGDACIQSFVRSFGRKAFRRPLTPDEVDRWTWIATDLAEGDPWLGARLAAAGMLQSPHFVYRVELGTALPDTLDFRRYTDHEMAARLSFLLWNAPPDDALRAAADAGELSTADQIEAQARRMLEDPRARDTIDAFFAQYLDLGRLDGVSPDAEAYPDWDPSLVEAMRTEVRLIVDDHVNRRDVDVRGIFSTRRTFVNAALAQHYGVDAPGATPITFVPVELPADGERAGLLTLGAFLTMNAHPVDTSPTLRGKYLLERVLCTDVPPPPDNVNLDLSDESGEARTLRERLDQHRNDDNCRGCHQIIDPPGFLFEHFDATGAWRDEDSGYPVDASGAFDGQPIEGARALADRLGSEPRVGRCIVEQLYRHAQGRLQTDSEEVNIDQIDAEFAASGHRFRELLVHLVTHDSYRHFRAGEAP